MRNLVAITLGILVATLTLSGVGHAQGLPTVQGTIQAVDCQTHTLVLRTSDGIHAFPAGPSTAIFVNSTPTNLCALQPYTGSSATVSVAPAGGQWVAERVDVNAPATTVPPTPTYSAAPPWLGIVLGTIIVGGLVYLLVRGHDGAVHRYPYSGPYDPRYGPYGQYGPYYGPQPYPYDPRQQGPYRWGPGQYGPYQYNPYQYGPYLQCFGSGQDVCSGGRDQADGSR